MRGVTTWTGREVLALRKAMRLTVRDFAEHLDVAQRTVANWESPGRPRQPRLFYQAMLDTVLAELTDTARDRFHRLLDSEPCAQFDTLECDTPAPKISGRPENAGHERR